MASLELLKISLVTSAKWNKMEVICPLQLFPPFYKCPKKKLLNKCGLLLGYICLYTKQCSFVCFNSVCKLSLHHFGAWLSTCMFNGRIGWGICQYCWKLHIQIPCGLCYMYVIVTLYYKKLHLFRPVQLTEIEDFIFYESTR